MTDEQQLKLVDERWDAVLGHWRRWRQTAASLRDLYDEGPDFTLQDAGGQARDVVRPTIGADKPDAATDQTMGDIRISITPWHSGKGAIEAADAYERFMTAQLAQATRGTTTSEIRGAVLDAQISGLGVLRVGADVSRYPDRPTLPDLAYPGDTVDEAVSRWQDRCEFISPIYVEAVDPLTFWGDPVAAGERWGFICYRRPIADVKYRHPDLVESYRERIGALREDETVWWREYHDDEWTLYDIIQGSQTLDQAEEPAADPVLSRWYDDNRKLFRHRGVHAGFVPLSSGRGRVRGLPEHKFVGLVAKALQAGIVHGIAELMTAIHVMGINGAWGALIKPKGTGDIRFGPGQQNEMDPEHIALIRTVYGAQIPPQTIQYLNLMMQMFHASTIPALLETPDSPSGDAAYKLNIQIQQARTSLAAPKEALSGALVKVCQKIHRLLKNPSIIDQDRPVRLFGDAPSRGVVGVQIVPRELPEVVRITVEVRDSLPVDEGQRQRTGNEAVQAGAISQEYNREHFYQIGDPEGESVQIAVEVARKALLQQVIEKGLAFQWILDYQAGKVDPTKTKFSQYIAAVQRAAADQQAAAPAGGPDGAAQPGGAGAAPPGGTPPEMLLPAGPPREVLP